MVTFSPPIRPAIWVPLNTRDGVAQAPMEPGARWVRWEPCEARHAAEAVALHRSREALALADGGDVDLVAVGEQVGLELLAHRVVGDVVEPQLHEAGTRVDSGLLELAQLRAW